MEQGVKLVGKVLMKKLLNKWGVRNILRSAWKEFGVVDVKWVKENVYVITVADDHMATRILDQVPWGIMKKNLSVKKWPPHLALEEIVMEMVSFWTQIRGVPLGMSPLANVKKLTQAAGEVLDLEDTAKARGFLRARILINTANPLCLGCWLRRGANRDTWVEFRYERLQDFCYRCGRLDHINTECTFDAATTGTAGYGEWTKAPPIREDMVLSRSLVAGVGKRRQAGTARASTLPTSPRPEPNLSQQSTRVGAPTSDVMADPQLRLSKRWRRRERGQASSNTSAESVLDDDNHEVQGVSNVRSLDGKEMGISRGVDRWDIAPSGKFSSTGVMMDPSYIESSGLKRGGSQRWDYFHNPIKKVRGIEFLSNPSTVMAENWMGQMLPERCLMIERAVYMEGETMEGSNGRQCLGVDREEGCVDDNEQDKQSELSFQARGGGGWPSTAARLP
ncbi:hypothetical protein EV1_040295 [Malus domestica]